MLFVYWSILSVNNKIVKRIVVIDKVFLLKIFLNGNAGKEIIDETIIIADMAINKIIHWAISAEKPDRILVHNGLIILIMSQPKHQSGNSKIDLIGWGIKLK